jgi:general stress protein 26
MVQHAHHAVTELAALISGIRIAMLTTADRDGNLHSRPMATQEEPFDGDLWFFTGQSTHKVEEIRAHPAVALSYADPREQLYVSVSGQAEVVVDGVRMRELWRPAYQAWFPRGLDDPDLALLRIHVEEAEYWRSHGTVVTIAGFIKALTTGQRAETSEHRYVRM